MSNHLAAQRAQGYRSAIERPRCATCQHASRMNGDGLSCTKGSFFVAHWGICERFELKGLAEARRLTGGVAP